MTDGDCLFCKIVSKDVAAQVVLDRDDVLAFRDVNPQAPTHVLVIPKQHVASLEAVPEDGGQLLASLVAAANEVARTDGVAGAYRLVTNVGRGAGQSVDHLHLHVLGGRGLTWPRLTAGGHHRPLRRLALADQRRAGRRRRGVARRGPGRGRERPLGRGRPLEGAARSSAVPTPGRSPRPDRRGFNARTRVHEYGAAATPSTAAPSSSATSPTSACTARTRGGAGPDHPGATVHGRPPLRRHLPGPRRPPAGLCARAPRRRRGPQRAGRRPRRRRRPTGRARGRTRLLRQPRISPDGRRLAWLEWDHPNMPWDGTELRLATLAGDGLAGDPVTVAGGPAESVFQPEWSPGGVLHLISDRTGWWNLYRVDAGGTLEALAPATEEFGHPQWVFGLSTYAFLPGGRIACIHGRGPMQRLGVRTPTAPWSTWSCRSRPSPRRSCGRPASGSPASPAARPGPGPWWPSTRPAAGSRCCARARTPSSIPATSPCPSRSSSRPRAAAPPTPSTTRRPTTSSRARRGAATAGGGQPRRPHLRGVQRPARRLPVLHQPGIAVVDVDYGGRPATAAPTASAWTASGGSSTSTTAWPWPGSWPPAATSTRTPGHPRRQRRRLHHPVRPDLPRRLLGRGQLLRRGRRGRPR